MEQIWDEGDVVFIVDAVRGASDAVPSHRDWTIVFRGVGFVGSGFDQWTGPNQSP